MKSRKPLSRIVVMVISICMVIAYTPVGVFAETEGDSQNTAPAQTEQITQENTPTDGTAAAENIPAISEEGTAPAAADADSLNNTDNTINNEPETPAETEAAGTETDTQSLAEQNEESEELPAEGAVNELAYDEDGSYDENYDENYGVNNESLTDDDMPSIFYLIAVVFNGIKKASLISSKYELSFDGLTFYLDGTNYWDTVSFTKDEASIEHDKHGNVILRWLFDGHRYDDYGNDTYTILDTASASQSHTHIPGYKFKGSTTINVDLSIDWNWEDEEYSSNELSQYLMIAGVSVTGNKYEKTGYAAASASDYSPATGDYQKVGLFSLIMILSLVGALVVVMCRRRGVAE